MKHQTCKILSSIVVMLLGISISMAHAQTPQETLNQYVSDLQKNPNDNALREKIIRLVQTMTPKPAIPEEAKKHLNRGMAAAESAKNENDYKDAIEEFQKAVNIAPWLGIGYRNLAVVQDKVGQYSPALQNLKLFLLTNPSAADAEAAKSLMDKIEYRQEKAAKESSPEAVAAKKEREQEDFLKKINGARYIFRQYDVNEDTDWKLVVLGDEIIQNKCFIRSDFQDAQKSVGRCYHFFTFKIDGRRLQCTSRADLTGVISDDGNTITLNYKGGVTVYKRER